MQTSELDQKNNKDTGDVDCINFRPSPNFKHMRKYLKAHSSPNQSSDRSTSPSNEEQEQVNRESETSKASTSSMAQPGQPPLPPNSPPPDLVVPKQEVEDESYLERAGKRPDVKVEAGVVKTEKPPEKTMCRQFARGTCTRGPTCIYVHELILAQLPGVYTFCKNFQNSICKFPMCKFVHATVFEKEHFYRTGYLPPHSLAHLKESNSALAPPSNPVEAPAAEAAVMNPPPNMHAGVSMNGAAPPAINRPMLDMHAHPSRAFPPPNPLRHESIVVVPEVCPTCDNTAPRLLYVQHKHRDQSDLAAVTHEQLRDIQIKEARLDKLFTSLIENKFGPSGSSRGKDIDTVFAEFILKELEESQIN